MCTKNNRAKWSCLWYAVGKSNLGVNEINGQPHIALWYAYLYPVYLIWIIDIFPINKALLAYATQGEMGTLTGLWHTVTEWVVAWVHATTISQRANCVKLVATVTSLVNTMFVIDPLVGLVVVFL